MNVVKFALFFILDLILSISCVLTETLQNLSTFCHFSFEGWGGGVKKETKGIKFLSDIDILTTSHLTGPQNKE